VEPIPEVEEPELDDTQRKARKTAAIRFERVSDQRQFRQQRR